MQSSELHIEMREGVGKGPARQLRMQGKVPGIFYGPHVKKPIALSVERKELSLLVRKMTQPLITLKADGSSELNGKMALLKEDDRDPITGEFLHVDFYEVRADEDIKVSVPVVLTGKSKGVAEGGILEQLRRDVEVRCLPKNIPARIELDVTELDIGDNMHVKDLQLPTGVEFATSGSVTVVSVGAPQQEEAAKPGPEAAAADGAPAAEGDAAKGKDAPADAAGGDAAKAEGEKSKGK